MRPIIAGLAGGAAGTAVAAITWLVAFLLAIMLVGALAMQGVIGEDAPKWWGWFINGLTIFAAAAAGIWSGAGVYRRLRKKASGT